MRMTNASHYRPATVTARAVLWDAGVPTRMLEPLCAPQLVTLGLRVLDPKRAPTPARCAAFVPMVEAALRVDGVRVVCASGIIRVEVPRRTRAPLSLDAVRAEYPRVGMGVTPRGGVVSFAIDDPRTAHALIVGQTGSGKSALLRAMVCQLAGREDVTLALIDPEGRDWGEMAGHAHIAETADDAAALLEWARAQIGVRIKRPDSARVVLAIDEAQTLAGTATMRALVDLMQRGRKHGVHIWAATPLPSADVLDRHVATQFGVRVCGYVNNADTSTRALGVPDAGAQRLMGHGDMIVARGRNLTRFQAPLCVPADWPEPRAAGDCAQSIEIIEHLRAQPSSAEPPVRNAAPNARRDVDAGALDWIMAQATRTASGWRVPGANQIAARYGIGNTAAQRWQNAALSQLSQASQDSGGRVLRFEPRASA